MLVTDPTWKSIRMRLTVASLAAVERGGELEDDDGLAVLRKQANQRRDAIDELRQANRPEFLASKRRGRESLRRLHSSFCHIASLLRKHVGPFPRPERRVCARRHSDVRADG